MLSTDNAIDSFDSNEVTAPANVAEPSNVATSKTVLWKLPPLVAFVGATLAFVGLTFAAGAPSPLFVLYQQEWHFESWLLTVAFAIYAITLLVTILIAGSVSDYLGRRPVLMVALLTELASTIMFAFADNITWIIVARAVQGIATGAATSTFTATIVELAPPQHKKLGSLIGSIAPFSGLAIGALFSGFAIEFSQAPSLIVFTFLAIIFALGVLTIYFATETVVSRPGALQSLRPHLAIPQPARRDFISGSFVLVATWMLAGLYFGLGPSVLRSVFHISDGLVSGFLVAVPPIAATFASLTTGRLAARYTTLLGISVAVLATALTTVAILVGWFPLFLVSAILSGAGFGAAFSGILRTLGPLANPARRAELFAGVYLISYLAYGAPALVAGIVIGYIGLQSTVIGYGLINVTLAVIGLVAQYRQVRYAQSAN